MRPFFRYCLAGLIIVTVTLSMLAITQFVVTGKVKFLSFVIIG